MLIELSYEEIKGARVKATKDGKSKSLIPIALCDSTNIADACAKYSTWKHIVPIKYVGDTEILPHMLINNVYVFVERMITEVDMTLEFEINQIDPRVHIVFILPDGYNNIKAVHDACMQYQNIRFIGGNLANIEGVRLGLIDLAQYSTRDLTKLPIHTDGLEGYAPVLHKSTFDEIDFSHKEKPLKVKTTPRAKVEKAEKQVSKPKKEKAPKKTSLFESFI